MKMPILAAVLLILPGCASRGKEVSQFCDIAKPIPAVSPAWREETIKDVNEGRLKEAEVLPTLQGINVHNRKGITLCGWERK